jgi:transcriptional regulator with XRE-family HTH domain
MDILNTELEANRILVKNIKDYMELNSIKSVDEYALKCGTNKAQIYNIFNEKTIPKIDYIDRLAGAMGITSAQLLTENYFDQFEKKIVRKK